MGEENVEQLYLNGARYRGEMKNGLKEGKGTMTWMDGAQYQGMWHNDMANGLGRFTHPNRGTYEGTRFRSQVCRRMGQ